MRILTFVFTILAFEAMSQAKPVKIVFDITSSDTLAHQAVMRHVSGMAAAYPQSTFEVVIYGGALPMVIKNKSSVAKGIQKLENNPNVSFKVCQVTMDRYNVTKAQLIGNVVIVPDAIIEIVTKQGEGWGYIKEAHH
jgi:intracellular sulfur oxidation DsrE/DsrF family protein